MPFINLLPTLQYNAIISTQVRDENEYLDEWVRYHLLIGFDHIVIYDNKSIVPVKNFWGKQVTVIKEEREFEGSAEDNCHNDTIKNFDAYWVARIDVDEFIVLKEDRYISTFLEPYEDFGGVGINWRIFGTSGHTEKPEGLVRNNYFWRMPDNCGWILNGGSYHLKTIINRQYCLQIHHPHFCRSSRPLVNEDFCGYPDAWTDSTRNKAVIHHYITKSVQEWQRKYDLWRHKYGLRTMNELADIDRNCIIYDDTLKTQKMDIGKTWQWASHQPLIKGVLDLYSPGFILELGIGENSTPLFAGLNYLGVENDKEWIKHIGSTCRANQLIMWHDLDRQKGTLAEYYDTIPLPEDEPKLLFVDNYESCRAIAINTLRNKFDIVIFHDCEPEPGARVNHYGIVNSDGFNVYFLKTSANWTAIMIRTSIDIGFGELLLKVNKHIAEFKHAHPDMKEMFFDNIYQR